MYTLEKKEKDVFKILIKINNEEWNGYINQAYEETKAKFAVQGFRKGKAPRKVIEQNYGASIFFDDALEIAFAKEYENILEKEKQIKPVAQPELSIEKFDENGIEILVSVQSEPEVKLGEYKGLEIESAKGKVSKDKIDAEINQARERQARFVEVQTPAKMGDFVCIDFVGSIDGKEFDGGKAEDHRLELGSKSFVDTFEDQIVGMKIGESKTITVKFPDNYPPELKSKIADFAVTLKKVEEKQLPELNDEFASSVSEFETFDAYKKDIVKHLEESLQAQLERETENKIIEAVVKNATVEVPEIMIQKQTDAFLKDFEMRLSYQGMKLQDYYEYTKSTEEQFKKDKYEDAKITVKTRLVLEALIKQENLLAKPEEIDAKVQEIATKYKKSLEDYKKNISERELVYIENGILMEKLINFLKSNNQIK
ncbi:MAG: trigger factor [Clostridia bacterium]|nr:trigger factor [Clostridia bacterium]